MEKKKSFIIGVLTTIIVVLTAFVVLLATNTISFNSDKETTNNNSNNEITNNNQKEEGNKVSYKEYKINDEIILDDGSKWIVIKNSSKESDYVTLIEKDSKDITDSNTYYLLLNDLLKTEKSYDNSEIKTYVNSLEDNIPVKLKEVDGYKIRLITIEEIFELYHNWKYDDINDNYKYVGNDYENMLYFGLTMSKTKCNGEKCYTFYSHLNVQKDKTYYLSDYTLGLPQIKPVINVYKTELEK